MVSNVSFREQLKRMRPSFRVRRPVWEDRYKIHKTDRSELSAFFLSTKHTPGCHSSNPLKRSSARIWHEFKSTLLSGVYTYYVFVHSEPGLIMGRTCQLHARVLATERSFECSSLGSDSRFRFELLRNHSPCLADLICDPREKFWKTTSCDILQHGRINCKTAI